MRLRRKLLLYLAVPALLIAAVGVGGLYSLQHLQHAAGRILANNYRSIQEARAMEAAVRALELAVLARPSCPDGCRSVLETQREPFLAGLLFCEGNVTEEAERPVLRRLRRGWERIETRFGRGVADAVSSSNAADRGVLEGVQREILELVRVNEHAMFRMESHTRDVGRLMTLVLLGTLAAALLALFAFAVGAAAYITQPILAVATRLHRAVGQEPPSRELAPEKDEIARLRREMDEMLERLARFQDEQRRKVADAQMRLALIMNRVLEGLVLVDDELRILAANSVGSRLLGLTDERDATGLPLAEATVASEVREALAVLQAGQFLAEQDLDEVRSSVGGEIRVYRPRVMTVSGADQSVEGYLVIFWDVTRERQFEESRRRFISMLSHQLKTPMTSLSMSVNMLRERLQDLPERPQELLDMATEDCRSLAALVTELVEAARGASPDFSLSPRIVELNGLLQEALAPLVPQATQKGVALTTPQRNRGFEVFVDPVKFPWVVTNLVGNALRYTPSGGTIAVTTRGAEEGVTVDVQDTGRGMPRTLVNRIFTPYVTADQAPAPGTHGLGLAIVREIVEAHGGTIGVESEPDRGTLFSIWLPWPKRRSA